jgi:hypothetical protein
MMKVLVEIRSVSLVEEAHLATENICKIELLQRAKSAKTATDLEVILVAMIASRRMTR